MLVSLRRFLHTAQEVRMRLAARFLALQQRRAEAIEQEVDAARREHLLATKDKERDKDKEKDKDKDKDKKMKKRKLGQGGESPEGSHLYCATQAVLAHV